MPTEYLQKLIDYLEDKDGIEDSTCLNRVPHLGQQIVSEHNPRDEDSRADQEDGIISKWLETSLGDAKYEDLFKTREDTQIMMNSEWHEGEGIVCADSLLNRQPRVHNYKSSIDPVTLQSPFKSSPAGKAHALHVDRNYFGTIVKNPKNLFPDFYPLYLGSASKRNREPYDILALAKFTELEKAHGEGSVIGESEEMEDADDLPKANHCDNCRYIDTGDPVQKLMSLPSNRFWRPDSLPNYAHKQMRKQLFNAIEAGDANQVVNHCETFSRIFRMNPDECANYQLPDTGETALHLALLIDYVSKKPAYVFEPEIPEAQ